MLRDIAPLIMLLLGAGAIFFVRLVRSFFHRDLRGAFARGEERQSGSYIPGFFIRANKQSELEHAIILAGSVFRYNDKQMLPPSAPLWQTLLDDDTKWNNQGRFAGSNINCGHFFALSEEVAKAEAGHYQVDMRRVNLLEVKIVVDKILDLTSSAGMRFAYEANVEEPDASDAFIAEELVEVDTGGTMLTDVIGHWAITKGYNGILFLASRNIWGPERTKGREAPPKPWDYDLFSAIDLPIIKESRELNLVLFRGTWLLSRISRYRVSRAEWIRNEYYRKSPEEIDLALGKFPEYCKYNLEFQRSKRVVRLGGGIRYVPD